MKNNETGTLSIVATPIGNLEDITLRALRTLREAEYVLCEDTRVTGVLLSHHGIKAKLKRYDAHASEGVHEGILADLEAGKHIALVSDAGTPGVSDPGVLLVARARAVGARIEAIPGPSALTAALSLSGIAGNQFTFLGFVPQKKGRQTFFANLPTLVQPVIFFESTHRVQKTLESLAAMHPEATVTIARELTKIYEEVVVGTPATVREHFIHTPSKQKGEFVMMCEVPSVR
jgi:16S rRNA (cytidine1402-2'-O)-methyltransferase